MQAVHDRRVSGQDQKSKKGKADTGGILPEEEIYLAILQQVW